MLNDFLNSVKGELLGQLGGSTELEQGKLGGVADVVTDTFKNGLLDKFKKGQLGDIAGLLDKGGSSTSFAGSLVGNTVANLVSKMGLPKSLSTSVANVAVPFLIEKLGHFASSKGKTGEGGISDLIGDLAKGSIANNLLDGLGSKFGF